MWKIELYLIQRRKMLKTALNNYFTDVNADYQHAKAFISILRDNCDYNSKDFMNILHSELSNIKINQKIDFNQINKHLCLLNSFETITILLGFLTDNIVGLQNQILNTTKDANQIMINSLNAKIKLLEKENKDLTDNMFVDIS